MPATLNSQKASTKMPFFFTNSTAQSREPLFHTKLCTSQSAATAKMCFLLRSLLYRWPSSRYLLPSRATTVYCVSPNARKGRRLCVSAAPSANLQRSREPGLPRREATPHSTIPSPDFMEPRRPLRPTSRPGMLHPPAPSPVQRQVLGRDATMSGPTRAQSATPPPPPHTQPTHPSTSGGLPPQRANTYGTHRRTHSAFMARPPPPPIPRPRVTRATNEFSARLS